MRSLALVLAVGAVALGASASLFVPPAQGG